MERWDGEGVGIREVTATLKMEESRESREDFPPSQGEGWGGGGLAVVPYKKGRRFSSPFFVRVIN